MKKEVYNKIKEKVDKLELLVNGGKGSGNFGHSGRPGEVGGSGGGYAGIGSSKADKIEKMIDRKVEARRKIAETEALHGTGEMSGEEAAERIADLKAEEKGQSKPKEKKGGEISLRGKSLYEKVHMIEPGDEVHITPKDNLPNFDRKIKVDYIQDGTIHYGSSETSDGYTYPAWAIKDITKIVRKKKNSIYAEASRRLDEIEKMINGGKGSGNFGHAGRPGEVGGSGSGIGSSALSDEIKSVVRYEHERAQRGGAGLSTYEKCKEIARKIGLGKDAHDGADIIQDYAWSKHLLQEHQLYLKNPKRSSAGERAYQAELPVLKERIAKYEKAIKEALEKTEKRNQLTTNGGKGSGNFGHSGRPGEIGGSGKGGSYSKGDKEDDSEKLMAGYYVKNVDELKQIKTNLKRNIEEYKKDIARYKKQYEERQAKYEKTGEWGWDNPGFSLMNIDKTKEAIKKAQENIKEIDTYLKDHEKNSLLKSENGGKGSGNFGHSGRPGEVGGSGSRFSASESADKSSSFKDAKEARAYFWDKNLGGTSSERVSEFGFGYDEIGDPVRYSRFDKKADDDIWLALGSLQKLTDSDDNDTWGMADAKVAKTTLEGIYKRSQESHLGENSKAIEKANKGFTEGAKKAIKDIKSGIASKRDRAGSSNTLDSLERIVTQFEKGLDGFLGYNKTREYRD